MLLLEDVEVDGLGGGTPLAARDGAAADPASEAAIALQALGYPVDWHDYPMGHSVCLDEVRELRQWLLRVLAD